MDQDSTGTEDDANSIKDSLYLLDDLSFYFQVGCYTISAMLLMYMLGLVREKHNASKLMKIQQSHGQRGGGGEAMYQSKYADSTSDTAEFY
jgi:hypothetical protein